MAGYRPQNRGNRSANRTGSTVSRRLRAAGWNISPAARRHKADGMFVSAQGTWAHVLLDFGVAAKNTRVADQVAGDIRTWPEAEGVSISQAGDGAVFVHFDYVRP